MYRSNTFRAELSLARSLARARKVVQKEEHGTQMSGFLKLKPTFLREKSMCCPPEKK
jgi:hypothetical protein